MLQEPRQTVLGVSLKMYLDHAETLTWCREVAAIVADHAAVRRGAVELFVMPTFPSLAKVIDIFDGTPVNVGAQDLFWEDRGAFTGAVSGIALDQIGCTYVEVGHAERRTLFGETDHVVALKVAAALRNELRPVICVGEDERGAGTGRLATTSCTRQLASALVEADRLGQVGQFVVAYEPHWAIGARRPASPAHVRSVCYGIRSWLSAHGHADAPVIYGGSAGPGLLTLLGPAVDGLFLGRLAHDTAAVRKILDEVMAVNPNVA